MAQKSPSQAKVRIRQQYDRAALDVARGIAGYRAAVKSSLSKSPDTRHDHQVEFM